MQHRIAIPEHGPHGEAMARAVTTCVHCGFCLAACPTYRVLGEEMDSPRGRIVLMKEALEGTLSAADVLPYVDRCLGCLACETACPSGVRYRELVVPFRGNAERTARGPAARARRRLLLSILESPARFRAACAAGQLSRRLAPLLPAAFRPLLDLLPARLPPPAPLPFVAPAEGTRRARIALLEGCVQRVLRPSIGAAVIRLYTANGVEVVTPREQGCCGALALHTGLVDRGDALAARNRRRFPADVDAIVTTTAGCGSAMQEQGYPAAVRDVAEFLDGVGLRTPLALPRPTRVAYHDACHLSHGQGVRHAPRRLLAAVANLTLFELAESDSCCGSAGLYNLEQPDIAADLGRRKAAAIRQTGAQLVATGNIGCLQQIAAHLRTTPEPVDVQHTVEILAGAL